MCRHIICLTSPTNHKDRIWVDANNIKSMRNVQGRTRIVLNQLNPNSRHNLHTHVREKVDEIKERMYA